MIVFVNAKEKKGFEKERQQMSLKETAVILVLKVSKESAFVTDNNKILLFYLRSPNKNSLTRSFLEVKILTFEIRP